MTNHPRVSDILKPWEKFDNVPEDRLIQGQIRGNVAHATLACYAKGLWYPPVPSIYQGYVDSGKNWLDKYVIEILLVEETLVDEDMGFHGTPDLIVRMTDGILTLPDWKTPKAKSKMWQARMAAYRHLARHNGYLVEKVGTVRLREDGSPAIFDQVDVPESIFAGFHGALIAHKFFGNGG
jgi:hypothetical protein